MRLENGDSASLRLAAGYVAGAGFVRQNRPQLFVASDCMAVSAIFDVHEF
jgi:hypothetical protein